MNKPMRSISVYKQSSIIFGPSTFLNCLEKFVQVNDCSSCDSAIHAKNLLFIGENCSLLVLFIRLLLRKRTIIRLDGRRFIASKQTQNLHSLAKLRFIYLLKAGLIELNTFIVSMFSTKIIFQSNYIKSQWPHYLHPKSVVITNIGDRDLYLANPVRHSPSSGSIRLIYSKGYIGESILLSFLSKNDLANISLSIFGNPPSTAVNNAQIKYYGPVVHSQYLKTIHHHDAFICLEDFPPCPNAVIEAQIHGLPVVSLPWGSIPEIVLDHQFLLPSNFHELQPNIQRQKFECILDRIKNYSFPKRLALSRKAFEVFCQSNAEKYLLQLSLT